MNVVFDTSVLVAARSRQAASFTLVSSKPTPAFQSSLSVVLYAEGHLVLTRPENPPPEEIRIVEETSK
jgi:hypothetical protein